MFTFVGYVSSVPRAKNTTTRLDNNNNNDRTQRCSVVGTHRNKRTHFPLTNPEADEVEMRLIGLSAEECDSVLKGS
ncbi:hypothetical protein ABVT39_023112 [Epinephelus coioides]